MVKQSRVRAGALACALVFTATSCSSDERSSSTTAGSPATAAAATTTTTGAATTTTAAGARSSDLSALGLWDDGACDESKRKLTIGLQTVFASGVLTLQDQADALTASAKAFNARGGANGHCIVVHNCDDGADPNKAVNCVRDQDSAGVVVTVNDTTPVAGAEVSASYRAAGIPRFAISPGQDDYGDTNSYPFDAGGTGTSIMMPQGLLNGGKKKVAVVRVDIPAATALAGLFKSIFADNGLEIVGDSPVPAGTTDYSQFILAAQAAGADGVAMPLGGEEGLNILRAGAQLQADLTYSLSLGSYSYDDIASLGDYADKAIFNAAIPPATTDDPVIALLRADLAATGVDDLQPEKLKSSPMRSWVGLYALLHILRQAGTEDFSRANITRLIDASGPVPMLGITADWTPHTDHAGAFVRTGNNSYGFWKFDSTATFDGKQGNFVHVSDANWDQTICGSPVGGPCS